ncbi:MAG: hypothetical protein ACI3XI_09520 [Eubacteriales bacterium]
MGKHEKRKVKKANKARADRRSAVIAFVLLLVVVLVAFALFVMPQVLYMLGNGAGNTESSSSAQTSQTRTESIDAIAFPLLIEYGKLEIESVIRYDGLNPDCGNREGTDIATLTVRNVSDTYLERAEITMTSGNGYILTFVITDLPAGEAVLAFSRENVSVKSDTVYVDVICEAVFSTDASMSEELISVSVEGTAITLQNKTNESLSNVVVYCHATLGDRYFGGITYSYTIQTLPANGTAQAEAVDCILGLAEVVRITVSEP